MTRTDSISRTDFLNRLLSDEGGWPEPASLLDELATVYELNDVGFRWPAEGASLIGANLGSEAAMSFQYPLAIPNRPAGLFWANSVRKNKDELTLLANALSVSRTMQRFLGAFAEQERTAQRLEDAAKVAGRVAHDLDNVFQGVMGFTTLALERVQPQSLVAEHLREVQVSTDNGMRFCVQLHQLSRAGSAKPFPGSLHLAFAAEVKRLQGNEKKVVITWDVPMSLPPVAIDEGGLRQLFGHVLNNAVEASAPAQTVRVQARLVELVADQCAEWLGRASAGPHVEITIQDEGCGMDAAAQRRLFVEPFFTTKFRHRGLSLAVVYRMLYAHRGGVRVDSAVGQGTTMTFVLPFATTFRSNDSRTTGGSS